MARKPISEAKSILSERGRSPAAPAINLQAQLAEQEQIKQLAFSYWEARGGEGGSSLEDWLRAEGEIQTRSKLAAKH